MSFNVEEALDRVSQEVLRRLESGRVKDIPDGVMFRALNDLNKIAERRQDDEVEEETYYSLLDQLDSLPIERQEELLVEEVERLRGELKAHNDALKKVRKNASKQVLQRQRHEGNEEDEEEVREEEG